MGAFHAIRTASRMRNGTNNKRMSFRAWPKQLRLGHRGGGVARLSAGIGKDDLVDLEVAERIANDSG